MSVEPSASLTSTPDKLRRARAAAPRLACLSTQEKNAILQEMAELIAGNEELIVGFHDVNIGQVAIQYVCLLFSLCVHEAAHAFMADRCGDPSARVLGRATLNPLAHIDPMGTVIMPLLMMFTGVPLSSVTRAMPYCGPSSPMRAISVPVKLAVTLAPESA